MSKQEPIRVINAPTSWYEYAQYRFPDETPEFWRTFEAYWELRAHMEQLQDLLGIKYEGVPYRSVAHLQVNS